jgi:hypothetical protein
MSIVRAGWTLGRRLAGAGNGLAGPGKLVTGIVELSSWGLALGRRGTETGATSADRVREEKGNERSLVSSHLRSFALVERLNAPSQGRAWIG